MTLTRDTSSQIRTLRALSTGRVLSPGEDGYEEARQAWNLAADQHPAAVALPENESDVAFALACARELGLRVSVQGTGHNPMPLGDLSQSLLIRTSGMRRVEIDPHARIARVQAGALWRDVAAPASAHGLAALAGSSPDVGVVGYSLGGGIGYIGRKYGIQANSVTAIELVTADGELLRVDGESDEDLFWALRGGGGNFGVVTAMEFRLYAVEEIQGGWLVWPWERSQEVIERWAEWTRTVPDEVTSMARIMQLPPIDDVPEMLRGRQIVVVSAAILGTRQDADRLLAPLRALGPEIDTFAAIDPIGLSYLHGDPESPVPALSDQRLIDELPAEAVAEFVAKAGPESGSSLLVAELRHLGGAFGRDGEGHGALGRIDAAYVAFACGMPVGPEAAGAIERDSRELMQVLDAYGRGLAYSNFAERPIDARTIYSEETYERLCRVRRRMDPEGLLRASHELPPSAA